MSTTNSFILKNGYTAESVASGVSSFLRTNHNMETQVFPVSSDELMVQGRVNGGGWKRFVGMDKAISVKLTASGSILTVEIGEGKWLDKGLIMALSMIVLWPLAVTSGVGFYQQAQIPGKILGYISSILA